jgi:hypothetical protein
MMLKIMEKYLTLRMNKSKDLKRLYGIDRSKYKETSSVLSITLKHIDNPRPYSLLKILKKVSSVIPIFQPKTDMMIENNVIM